MGCHGVPETTGGSRINLDGHHCDTPAPGYQCQSPGDGLSTNSDALSPIGGKTEGGAGAEDAAGDVLPIVQLHPRQGLS